MRPTDTGVKILAENPCSTIQKLITSTMHPIFSYGSNSTAQLRARVNNPALVSRPAFLDHYVRIFFDNSSSWQGSVASLVRKPNGRVCGTLAYLTTAERHILDQYESGYDLVSVEISVYNRDRSCHKVSAFVYIADGDSSTTPPFPSEQYLASISGMLDEHWPADISSAITVRNVENGNIVERSTWTHPHFLGRPVSSLPALAVELNLRLQKPWPMPHAANAFTKMAAHLNVTDIWRMCHQHSVSHAVSVIAARGASDLDIDIDDMKQALRQVYSRTCPEK